MAGENIATNEGERDCHMKMWDGRFAKPSDSLMERFNNSLPFDKTLIDEDIEGSIAWAGALQKIGVFTDDELRLVRDGLAAIKKEYHEGLLTFTSRDEDIHMAVERLLTERIGEAASRLHTGRSRNDQVTTDLRLFTKKKADALSGLIARLQTALVGRACQDLDIIMPGFTHLQQAQPILMSHYWLSFVHILQREKRRFAHVIDASDVLPLGSGAMAGSGFNVDRDYLAHELGFSAVSANSIDGVSSRDYVLEMLSACSSLGITLSRYAEDLIIYSSYEFGFIELDDAWSTGSSMMPQKKNPDSLELIRGKCGRFIGNYTSLATTLKGIGLTYYKDLQEDKEPLFDSIYHMEMVLEVFANVIQTLTVKKERISEDLHPFLLATDFADYLVRKGLPFRQAHHVVGKMVGFCVREKRSLTSLGIDELRNFSPLYSDDVKKLYSWSGAVEGRSVAGGTSRSSVLRQIEQIEKYLL